MQKNTFHTHFINPYNFIQNENPPTRSPMDNTGNLTGYIRLHFTVKTPLCVPDIMQFDANGHRFFDFYSHGDEPIVPASELRGAVRSIFETITAGCFGIVSNTVAERRYYRSMLPALLTYQNDGWVLYPADKSKAGGEVRREWYNHRGEKTVLYFSKNGAPAQTVSDVQVARLQHTLHSYRFNAYRQPEKHIYFDQITFQKDGRLIPVFYTPRADGSVRRLSLAQVGRMAFTQTPHSLLGEFAPCKNDPCPTCKLFGSLTTVPNIASRVRFTDAHMVPADNATTRVTLKPLATPHPANAEFYTFPPDGKMKNATPWDYDTPHVTLRGRKMYFHNPRAADDPKVYTGFYQTKQNATFEIVKPHNVFAFKVYFDRISFTELQQLCLALNFGENDGDLMHKLGQGKPLGLGSIKMCIEDIYLRTVDGDGYALAPYTALQTTFAPIDNPLRKAALAQGALIPASPTTVSQLLHMADFAYIGTTRQIAYPISAGVTKKAGKAGAAGWFHWNKATYKSPVVRYVLPLITDNADDLLLPQLFNGAVRDEHTEIPFSPEDDVVCVECQRVFKRGTYCGKAEHFHCFYCRQKGKVQ